MRIKYSAKDNSGRNIKGFVEAANVHAAAGILREQKMLPIEMQEVKKGLNLSVFMDNLKGVSSKELTNFTRQLATMMTAGLPLTDALNLLKAQSPPVLSGIVGMVLVDVQSGVALSAALGKFPKVFNRIYVSLVKAGESAGLMEKILNRLADTAEKNQEFKGKIIGAMIYPIIILVGMVLVFILMIVLVVPQMKSMYADLNSELPFATRALIAISDFSVNNGPLIIIALVGIFFGIRSYVQTDKGRENAARLKFAFPLIGSLLRQSAMAEFSRVMSLLLSAGISIVESLRISADSAGNIVMVNDIKKIANQVEKGFPVSICFSESETFPPIFGQMVAVGEETGKMDDVMNKLSYYFETESDQRVKGLTTAIEPIILIVMAVGVGLLMYAIIMPMYGVMNKV